MSSVHFEGTSLAVQWLRFHLAMQKCRFDPWSGSYNPICLKAKKPKGKRSIRYKKV